jgi:hypothetical protein
MCDVVSAVTIGAAVLGGAVSYQNSRATQRYQEQVADQNKKIAEASAVDAERLGQREATEARMRTRQQLAQQTVGFGAQNVEQTGTALDILGDTAMFGEIDQESIRANAARRAWGYRVQGWNAEAEGNFASWKGGADRAGILLGTAGSVASAWPAGGGTGSGSLLTTQQGNTRVKLNTNTRKAG